MAWKIRSLCFVFVVPTKWPCFQATWNLNCGQEIINSSRGVIVSPGYPLGYPTYQNCSYIVRFIGKHIAIKFEEFDLERGKFLLLNTWHSCIDTYSPWCFYIKLVLLVFKISPILWWFQRGGLKLDEDLKFSEKAQNKCTLRMAKLANNWPSRFTLLCRQVGGKCICSYGTLEKWPIIFVELLTPNFD